MPIGMLFWLVMVLWLIFGLWWHWPADRDFRGVGGHLLAYLAAFLLGWRVFGFVVQ
jgi:hypothetical protein